MKHHGGKAELTRYRIVNGDTRRTELIEVDLGAVMRGEAAANILIEPFDSLSLKVGYIRTGEADFSNDLMFDRPGVMTKPGSAMSLQVTPPSSERRHW